MGTSTAKTPSYTALLHTMFVMYSAIPSYLACYYVPLENDIDSWRDFVEMREFLSFMGFHFYVGITVILYVVISAVFVNTQRKIAIITKPSLFYLAYLYIPKVVETVNHISNDSCIFTSEWVTNCKVSQKSILFVVTKWHESSDRLGLCGHCGIIC